MLKIALLLVLLALGNAAAYGQGYLQNCRYEYNSDFGQAGYVGSYRAMSGAIYSYFFPTSRYNWCPQSVDF
jgi:hypothetical protein